MAFPVSSTPFTGASANPPYSGTFIPEIWSTKLLERLYETTVLSSITNTDYEGEIRGQGDKVIIRQYPVITVRDYQADQELVYERPSEPTKELLIDKGKYFGIVLDDVMAYQSDIDLLNKFTQAASKHLQIALDQDVLGNIMAGVAATNIGPNAGAKTGNVNLGDPNAGTPVPLDVTLNPSVATDVSPEDLLLRLAQVLDEANVPDDGRWVVVPPWFLQQLKKSDIGKAYITGDSTSPLRNGEVGTIDRFKVFRSNLLPVDTTTNATYIYAGHRMGCSFAAQITKTEQLRSERSFATLVRGLMVYGYAVLQDTAIAVAYARPK